MNVEYENFDKAVEAMLKSHKPEDSILYIINGDNVIRQLKLQKGKTTIPFDEFKAAVLRENCISQSIVQRIKLFTPNFFNLIKEYNEEGDGLKGGSEIVVGLNGSSPAVEMMLRFLAYPRGSASGKECVWIDRDLNTERFREAPAEFGDLWIKALSSTTDSAFLTLYMSTELDSYQKAVAEADKHYQNAQGGNEGNEGEEEGSPAVNRRAACAEILASTLRGFSFMTLVPESLETLVSLPPCFPVIVKAFKQLAERFIAMPEWRESLAAPLGYALVIFANATPAQYLWGHPGDVRARAAIQPFAAMQPFKHLCSSALKTLVTEDVPKVIVSLIGTLAEDGAAEAEGAAAWKPCHRLLPVLLDTLGAISNGNKEFLEKLIQSTPILDIIEKALSEKPPEALPEDDQGNRVNLMFKINAYRFAYYLTNTSKVYEEKVKEMKLLDKVGDLVMWALGAFRKPEEATAALREVNTDDGYFLSEIPQKYLDALDACKTAALERLMTSIGYMLAGNVERACVLLGVLFERVLAEGTPTFEATAAFPELQFWFAGALKRFVGRDGERVRWVIDSGFWEKIFSRALMFLGMGDGDGALPATVMHVLMRQRVVELVLGFMDAGDVRKDILDKVRGCFAGSAECRCIEEHTIYAEVAASVLSKLALECYSLPVDVLQCLPTFLVESKAFKERLTAVQGDPAYEPIHIRYSTARSGMMNSIVI